MFVSKAVTRKPCKLDYQTHSHKSINLTGPDDASH